MHSVRFGLPVVFTEHALRRMAERAMSEAAVVENALIVKAVMHHWELQP